MFDKPNFTQVPNQFFELMPDIKDVSELKVTLYAIRQTYGYHKDGDVIATSQYMKHTGLSKPSVLKGISKAVERGTILLLVIGEEGNQEKVTLLNTPQNQLIIEEYNAGSLSKSDIKKYFYRNNNPSKVLTGGVKTFDGGGKKFLPTKEIIEINSKKKDPPHTPPEGAKCYFCDKIHGLMKNIVVIDDVEIKEHVCKDCLDDIPHWLKTHINDREGYAHFRNIYPRRKSEVSMIRAWNKLKPSKKLKERIFKDIENKKVNDNSWINGYSPYPATYLNGKKWEDEITVSPGAGNSVTNQQQTGKVYANRMSIEEVQLMKKNRDKIRFWFENRVPLNYDGKKVFITHFEKEDIKITWRGEYDEVINDYMYYDKWFEYGISSREFPPIKEWRN